MSNMKLWNEEVNTLFDLMKQGDLPSHQDIDRIKEYIYRLENAALLLDCLKEEGVDNWVGYPDAVEQQEELIKEYLNEQN